MLLRYAALLFDHQLTLYFCLNRFLLRKASGEITKVILSLALSEPSNINSNKNLESVTFRSETIQDKESHNISLSLFYKYCELLHSGRITPSVRHWKLLTYAH